jgi:hypothetical protein
MFIFPTGVVEVDKRALQKYPHEYAALAYVLEKSGFAVTAVFQPEATILKRRSRPRGREARTR